MDGFEFLEQLSIGDDPAYQDMFTDTWMSVDTDQER
jgi:hypothetical protein